MSSPRHRRDQVGDALQVRYDPRIPLRSSDFDAVSPFRAAVVQPAEQPSSALQTSDQLDLAHN